MTYNETYTDSTKLRRAGRPTVEDSRGFTFLELMLVMTILTVLTLLAIPVYSGVQTSAKIGRAETEIRAIEKSIQAFFIDNGRYPDNLDDLNRGDCKDPWGRPYRYSNIANGGAARIGISESHDKLNSDFDLYSVGEDGVYEPGNINDPKNLDDVFRAGNGSFVGTPSRYLGKS